MRFARWILHIEGLTMAAGATWLFTGELGWSWILFVALLLVPDVSLLGFLAGNRAGAALYDLAHNYVLAGGMALGGLAAENDVLLGAGLILSAHVGFDRLFGYGLKGSHGFKHTHLQALGPLLGQPGELVPAPAPRSS
jgi:hypothetical protein